MSHADSNFGASTVAPLKAAPYSDLSQPDNGWPLAHHRSLPQQPDEAISRHQRGLSRDNGIQSWCNYSEPLYASSGLTRTTRGPRGAWACVGDHGNMGGGDTYVGPFGNVPLKTNLDYTGCATADRWATDGSQCMVPGYNPMSPVDYQKPMQSTGPGFPATYDQTDVCNQNVYTANLEDKAGNVYGTVRIFKDYADNLFVSTSLNALTGYSPHGQVLSIVYSDTDMNNFMTALSDNPISLGILGQAYYLSCLDFFKAEFFGCVPTPAVIYSGMKNVPLYAIEALTPCPSPPPAPPPPPPNEKSSKGGRRYGFIVSGGNGSGGVFSSVFGDRRRMKVYRPVHLNPLLNTYQLYIATLSSDTVNESSVEDLLCPKLHDAIKESLLWLGIDLSEAYPPGFQTQNGCLKVSLSASRVFYKARLFLSKADWIKMLSVDGANNQRFVETAHVICGSKIYFADALGNVRTLLGSDNMPALSASTLDHACRESIGGL
eukprot:gene3781-13849_t